MKFINGKDLSWELLFNLKVIFKGSDPEGVGVYRVILPENKEALKSSHFNGLTAEFRTEAEILMSVTCLLWEERGMDKN